MTICKNAKFQTAPYGIENLSKRDNKAHFECKYGYNLNLTLTFVCLLLEKEENIYINMLINFFYLLRFIVTSFFFEIKTPDFFTSSTLPSIAPCRHRFSCRGFSLLAKD